jgi:hypothetical protein
MYLYDETGNSYLIDSSKVTIVDILVLVLVHVLVNILINVVILIHVPVLVNLWMCTENTARTSAQ